jgi:hypothetical protein
MVTLSLSRAQFGVLIALLEEYRESPKHPLRDECETLHKVLTQQAEDQD